MAKVIDIIKKEMAANRFRLKRISGINYDAIVDEISNSLHAKIHEQDIVPLGVVFSKNDLSNQKGIHVAEMQGMPIDALRTLADGRRTFVVYSGNSAPKLLVLDNAISDEIRLLELSDLAEGIAIKRDISGTVRIAQDGSLWLVENRRWDCKLPIFEHVHLVQECLVSMPRSLHRSMVSLLRMTYYTLSSRNVGTTLVWRVKGPEQLVLNGLSTTGLDLRELNLSVNDESALSRIEHLLKYNDGAVIVSPEGVIEYLGAHLLYKEDTATKISEDGGTRHTSAKRFSFEHSEAIVFVVSQDGPVSIYSDGYKVTEMAANLGSRVSLGLKKLVPEKAGDVDNHIVDVKCPNCDRNIRIEEVVVLGWKNNESVDCPCCQHSRIYSSMCWSLSARPIKF